MRERKRKNRRLGQRPFDIDILVPGFGAASGRLSDRVRCSAETRDGKLLQERRAMMADLGRRFLHDVIAARLNGLFTTEELELAVKGGHEAMSALVERSRSLRLDALVDRWMAVSRVRTKEASRAHVRSFTDFCGGNAVATTSHLRPERIGQWLSSLSDSRRGAAGRKRKDQCSKEALSARKRRASKAALTPGRAISAATRNRYMASLSAFCTFLVETAGVLNKHPIRGKIEAEAERKRLKPQMSGEDWLNYLAHLSSDPLAPPACALVATVLRFSGADIGELLGYVKPSGVRMPGIKVHDVVLDAANPVLQFQRQKVDTSAPRQVPCPRVVFNSIQDYVSQEKLRKTDEVFCRVDRTAFELAHRRARRSIGAPHFRIKDLRHLAAIGWIKNGVPLTRIQRWLGHSSIEQTAVYADFAPDFAHEGPLIENAMRMAETQT